MSIPFIFEETFDTDLSEWEVIYGSAEKLTLTGGTLSCGTNTYDATGIPHDKLFLVSKKYFNYDNTVVGSKECRGRNKLSAGQSLTIVYLDPTTGLPQYDLGEGLDPNTILYGIIFYDKFLNVVNPGSAAAPAPPGLTSYGVSSFELPADQNWLTSTLLFVYYQTYLRTYFPQIALWRPVIAFNSGENAIPGASFSNFAIDNYFFAGSSEADYLKLTYNYPDVASYINPPSYNVICTVSQALRGDVLEFTVTTYNINNGSLYWTILPTQGTVTAQDFSGVTVFPDSSFGGVLNIVSNSASFFLHIPKGSSQETAPEKFKFQIRHTSYSASVVAESQEITLVTANRYTISEQNNLTTVNEGTTVTLNIYAPDSATGTQLPFTLSGIYFTDVYSLSPRTGVTVFPSVPANLSDYCVVESDHYAHVTIIIASDLTTEGGETLTFRLLDPTGTLLIPAVDSIFSIFIADTSQGSPITSEGNGTSATFSPTGQLVLADYRRAMLLAQTGAVTLTLTNGAGTIDTTYQDVSISGIVNDSSWGVLLSNQIVLRDYQTWVEIFSGFIRIYFRRDCVRLIPPTSVTCNFTVYKV